MANGGAWGVRNRGGGAYNPDCDLCENCYRHGHTAEDCIYPASIEEPIVYKKGSFLRYLWCVIFHPKYHIQMNQADHFGIYCSKCDVKW